VQVRWLNFLKGLEGPPIAIPFGNGRFALRSAHHMGGMIRLVGRVSFDRGQPVDKSEEQENRKRKTVWPEE
jgi:hypothetical protein